MLVFPAAHLRGGVERITWQALHHLAARGPVAFVGHSLEPAIPGVTQIEIERHGGRALAPWRFRRAAARTVAEARERSDVIVTFGAECPPGDVCVVNSVHRSWLRFGAAVRVGGIAVPNIVRRVLARHIVLLRLERSYFRAARDRRVVVVSARVADDLCELYGVPREQTVVLHNGFSAAQCSPKRRIANRGAQREEWGIAPGAIALLFVGNELHRKGFDCLLSSVARADPAFEIHVVGRAPIEPYAARIAELGLTDRVHYHGSLDIGLAHAAADALVLPTQYEAFALTIVEALASGLPVVTTAVPGAGDLIEHGRNGLVQQDPGDVDELLALLTQLTDPAVRKRLAAAAPGSVADLEWERLMGRLDEIIQAS